MPETSDPFAAIQEGLVVRPGDTLVLRLGSVDLKEFDVLRAELLTAKDRLPPDVQVLIVSASSVEQMAVIRRGPDDA